MQERALSAKNLVEHSDRTLAEISANAATPIKAISVALSKGPLVIARQPRGGGQRRAREALPTAGRRACPWTFAKAFFKAGVVVRAAPNILSAVDAVRAGCARM